MVIQTTLEVLATLVELSSRSKDGTLSYNMKAFPGGTAKAVLLIGETPINLVQEDNVQSTNNELLSKTLVGSLCTFHAVTAYSKYFSFTAIKRSPTSGEWLTSMEVNFPDCTG